MAGSGDGAALGGGLCAAASTGATRRAAPGLGTGAGLLGGIAVSWILRNRLFGVQPFDPPTYLVACLLLVGTGLDAAAWAARSAVLRQPVTALNGE